MPEQPNFTVPDDLIDELVNIAVGNIIPVPITPRWRPIETAPKDGTVVDLFLTPEWACEPYPAGGMNVGPGMRISLPAGHKRRGFRFNDAFWDKYAECWRAKEDLHYVHKPTYPPTHWMPRPEDPPFDYAP